MSVRAWPVEQAVSVVTVLRASERDSIVSVPVPQLELDLGGVVGDRHHGLTRPSDTRQLRYPGLSALPIGSRLLLAGGAGLVCEGTNQPCRIPSEVIQSQFPWSRAPAGFVKAAYGRRGIVASVELPAPIVAGETFTVALSEQHGPPALSLARPPRTA